LRSFRSLPLASPQRDTGAVRRRIVLYRGSLHGTAFVEYAPFATQARALILRWLRTHERA
jgi:hypothetical protein